MAKDKTKLLCRLFGHTFVPVYIVNRKGDYRFIATYCSRCFYGYDELIKFVTSRDDINTYNESYFTEVVDGKD